MKTVVVIMSVTAVALANLNGDHHHHHDSQSQEERQLPTGPEQHFHHQGHEEPSQGNHIRDPNLSGLHRLSSLNNGPSSPPPLFSDQIPPSSDQVFSANDDADLSPPIRLDSTLSPNPSSLSKVLSNLRENPSAAARLLSALKQDPSVASQIFSTLQQNPSAAGDVASVLNQKPPAQSTGHSLLRQNPITSTPGPSTLEDSPSQHNSPFPRSSTPSLPLLHSAPLQNPSPTTSAPQHGPTPPPQFSSSFKQIPSPPIQAISPSDRKNFLPSRRLVTPQRNPPAPIKQIPFKQNSAAPVQVHPSRRRNPSQIRVSPTPAPFVASSTPLSSSSTQFQPSSARFSSTKHSVPAARSLSSQGPSSSTRSLSPTQDSATQSRFPLSNRAIASSTQNPSPSDQLPPTSRQNDESPFESSSTKAEYSFQWDVNDARSGNFYGHQEERRNVNTRGRYYVQLPDGRRMIVDYYVDGSGYHPTISYEGERQARLLSSSQEIEESQDYTQTEEQPSQGDTQTGQRSQSRRRQFNRFQRLAVPSREYSLPEE